MQFLVNLRQRVSFMVTLSTFAPCLLTATSAIWDMKHERLFVPTEHLCIQGIPIHVAGRLDQDRFAVELIALASELNAEAINLLAGKGMNLIVVGSALLFLLCTVARAPVASPRPESPISVTSDKGNDADPDDDPDDVD